MVNPGRTAAASFCERAEGGRAPRATRLRTRPVVVETGGSRDIISGADERRYCELYPTGRRGDSAAVSLGRRNWDQERVSPHPGATINKRSAGFVATQGLSQK